MDRIKDDPFKKYLRHVFHEIPLLTKKELEEIDEELRKPQNQRKIKNIPGRRKSYLRSLACVPPRLIESHLRLVVRLAKEYLGYGSSLEDLISAGNIGLLKAAQRYDPDYLAQFGAYSILWIRHELSLYVMADKVIRNSAAKWSKAVFPRLKRIKQKRGIDFIPDKDTAREIMKELGFSAIENPAHLMWFDWLNSFSVRSLNEEVGVGHDQGVQLQDLLIDESVMPVDEYVCEKDLQERRKKFLDKMLRYLDPRERDVFIQRRLKEVPDTLVELGEKHHVSKQYIQQLEMRALKKMKEFARTHTPDLCAET